MKQCFFFVIMFSTSFPSLRVDERSRDDSFVHFQEISFKCFY